MNTNTLESRRHGDQAIKQYFARLRTHTFQTSLTPAEAEIAENVSHTKPRNVYYVGGRWFVKIYLGGKQRTWGVFLHAEYEQAFRLADMVVMRFWKYRRDSFKAPTDDNFNITLNRAKLDNENESGIVSELLHIESALIRAEYLNLDPRDKTRPAEYRTVSTAVAKQHAEVLTALDRLFKQQHEIAVRLDRIEAAQRGVVLSPSPEPRPYEVTCAEPLPTNPLFTCENTGCAKSVTDAIVGS